MCDELVFICKNVEFILILRIKIKTKIIHLHFKASQMFYLNNNSY